MHFKVIYKRLQKKKDFKAKKGSETKKYLQTKAHHEDIKITNKNVNLKTVRSKIPQVLYKMI